MLFDEAQFRLDLGTFGAPANVMDRIVTHTRAIPEEAAADVWCLAAWILEDIAANVPTSFNDQGDYEFDVGAVDRYLTRLEGDDDGEEAFDRHWT
jgi:hypothetical protein